MAATKIDWCDAVWNPVTGCSKISIGCDNCYAMNMANRLKGRFGYPAENPFAITLHEDKLNTPFTRKTPRRIFVNSMSDLFHDDVPFEWVVYIMARIYAYQQHTFIILTKRPERMLEFFNSNPRLAVDRAAFRFGAIKDTYDPVIPWPLPNLWFGVSVENQENADRRIPLLLQVPAAKKLISVEPMLARIDLSAYISAIDWVICGGENGRSSRPLHHDLVRSLRDQSVSAGVPFFFKGWGEYAPVRYFNTWTQWANKAQTWMQKGDVCVDAAGQTLRCGKDFKIARYPVAIMRQVGKRTAGRVLDSREWREVPA